MWKTCNLFALCYSCFWQFPVAGLSIYNFLMSLLQRWIDLTAYIIMPSTLIISAHRMNAVCARFMVSAFKIEQNILWVWALKDPLQVGLHIQAHFVLLFSDLFSPGGWETYPGPTSLTKARTELGPVFLTISISRAFFTTCLSESQYRSPPSSPPHEATCSTSKAFLVTSLCPQ